jgi:hypothetical protein
MFEHCTHCFSNKSGVTLFSKLSPCLWLEVDKLTTETEKTEGTEKKRKSRYKED